MGSNTLGSKHRGCSSAKILKPRPRPHSAIRIPQFAFPPLLLLSAEPMVCAVMNQFWLVKQEPTAYSWNQFAADGKTDWTGVRNFQARMNLRTMKLGDSVLYYHSVNGKAVVGLAKVTRAAFPDPTAAEGDWSAVELTAVKAVEPPVKLEQIKAEPRLSEMQLLKNSRLSV